MENNSLVVADPTVKSVQTFAQISYENQLALITDKSEKEFKRRAKKADKLLKRKTKAFTKSNRPKTMVTLFAYLGANFILPVLLGGLVGIGVGIFSDITSVFEMVKSNKIGNIDPMYSMMIQGVLSMGIIRIVIEIIKLPWRKLGFDEVEHPNAFVNIVNSIINFFPRIITQLTPAKEQETVEDYIEVLENDPNSRTFIKDPETKAKFYILRFLSDYQIEKPKAYNYKLLHAFKGAVKYAITGGVLSIINPLENLLPMRVFIVTISGAITEFILKRNVDKSIIRSIQQKNADFYSVTKKLDEGQKDRFIGYLASRWFSIAPVETTPDEATIIIQPEEPET